MIRILAFLLVLWAAPAQAQSTVAQVPGTTTNDSANSGNLGEYISSSIASGSAISLTTITAADITNISLTAGDWDVTAMCAYKGGATTVMLFTQCSISLVSATISTTVGQTIGIYNASAVPFGSIVEIDYPITPVRINLAATTTVYLSTNASFSVSTLSAFGIIRARRVR